MSRLCPALLVSAPASGQGKTSVTAALARAHTRQGRRVRVFKTGPDFLDPMILERASGAPVYQLDPWMGGEDDVRARLHEAAGEADLILVEGVMGLFDGSPSSADLAIAFGLPVVAVIDGSAMAQTFGALAHGLATYRPELTLRGVLANRVGSPYHAGLLRESLPPGITWFGALPRDPAMTLPERHLGLVAASELGDLDARLDALADAWIAQEATALPPPVSFASPASAARVGAPGRRSHRHRTRCRVRLHLPREPRRPARRRCDTAFLFPVAGDPLPACDAVWLPGGYPELHIDALAARDDLRRDLRAHVEAGRPLLAECGGLLYALDRLADRDGHEGTMAGLLKGHAAMQPRLAALGMQGVDLPEGALRGHSFHYAQASIDATPLAGASNPHGGPTAEKVYRRDRMTASFVHFYFPSNPDAALRLFLR